jgi:hypothetical protein
MPWNFSSVGFCNRQGLYDIPYLQKSHSNNSYSKGYYEDTNIQKSLSNEFYKNNYQVQKETELGGNYIDSSNRHGKFIIENQGNDSKQENICSNNAMNTKKILINRPEKKAEFINRNNQNNYTESNEFKPKQREEVFRINKDEGRTKKIIVKKENAGINSNSNTDSNNYGKSKLFPEEDLKPNQMYFYNNSKSKVNEEKFEKKKQYLIIK